VRSVCPWSPLAVLDSLKDAGSSLFWQRWHATWALVWLVNVPLAVVTDLKQSISYLIFVSLMTAFSGEMAALHGVTVQRNQEDEGA
jgi:hypothetical protein